MNSLALCLSKRTIGWSSSGHTPLSTILNLLMLHDDRQIPHHKNKQKEKILTAVIVLVDST